jgi:hypothetical protein
MLGQFIIPGAPTGLSVKAFLRNTSRNGESLQPDMRRKGMSVDLRVFRFGQLEHHDPDFAKVPYNGVQEISATTCSEIHGNQSDLLIVARCSLPDGDGYFGQEHQLIYENLQTGAVSSLLYDQSPIPRVGSRSSPIVLLAPKIWLGKTLNSFVAFASTNSTLQPGVQARPLKITVLTQKGEIICANEYPLMENSTFLFDVKEAVSEKMEITDAPVLLTIVAKGGASSFAIMTFAINESTGNFALEHSLPPDYYISGDRQRVRLEALEFGAAKGE